MKNLIILIFAFSLASCKKECNSNIGGAVITSNYPLRITEVENRKNTYLCNGKIDFEHKEGAFMYEFQFSDSKPFISTIEFTSCHLVYLNF